MTENKIVSIEEINTIIEGLSNEYNQSLNDTEGEGDDNLLNELVVYTKWKSSHLAMLEEIDKFSKLRLYRSKSCQLLIRRIKQSLGGGK